MALNWAMVDATGERPVPLPEEKIFLAVEKCQMSLEFKTSKSKWEANGTVYVTNQRVVFLRQPPLPAPADQSQPSEHLRSLNVPLSHLVDCRYMIPVLAGPYYEAGVIPVPGGNLPEAQPGGPTVKGLLKIWFTQGGGAAFRDAVEEVRNLSKGGQHGEQLPAYQPQPGTPGSRSVAPSVAATVDSSIGNRTAVGAGEYAHSDQSSSVRASTRPHSRGASASASHIAPEDLEAARVAMAQEEAEREAIRREAERAAEPSSSGGMRRTPPPIDQGEDGGPPSYDAVGVSPVTTFVPSQGPSGGDGDQAQPPHHQVSSTSTERAKSRAKIRARRMRAAAVKIMTSFEGRDRFLQLIRGLALLTHHSFGSVKQPRSFGLYPVPHLLFFLFPRRLRRNTLNSVHLAGELVDKWRKLLLFLAWCSEAGLHMSRLIWSKSSKGKGKEKANEKQIVDQSNSFPSPELIGWHATAAELGELFMMCCDAAEVAAVLGGSSLVWRISSAGYASRGHKALNYRQRHGLERAAFGFASIGLCLQLYSSQIYRKRARKCLGQAHRRVLLLTDDLADAQQDVDDETWPEKIPTLHREEAPAKESSSSLSTISASLKSAETHFQHVRLGMKRAGCEMVTNGCELVFALYELVLPTMEKEALEGWSEVGAGLTGIWRVFLN